ncbi:MAG TPA: hypothetical protein VHT03_12625 [Rhizomicrobium sp.]|jgi:hypothetical protein|nr:hypothetical protein [Rhizomicrobium sp.]
MTRLSLSVGFVALLTTHSFAAADGGQSAGADASSRLKQICENVEGASGTALHACTSTLSDALAIKVQSELATKNARACAARGLTRGTPEFSNCVLDLHEGPEQVQTDTGAFAPRADVAGGVQIQGSIAPASSHAAFDSKRQREERACAQLGLDPGGSVFAECVAGLGAGLSGAGDANF